MIKEVLKPNLVGLAVGRALGIKHVTHAEVVDEAKALTVVTVSFFATAEQLEAIGRELQAIASGVRP